MLKQYRCTGEIRLKGVIIENHSLEYGFPTFTAVPLDKAGLRCPSHGIGWGDTPRNAIKDLKLLNVA